MVKERSSEGKNHSEEDINSALEYGFMADQALIAVQLIQSGESLTEDRKKALSNCSEFLDQITQLIKHGSVDLHISPDHRLVRVWASGDVRMALGVEREENNRIIFERLLDLTHTAADLQLGQPTESEKLLELCKFLDHFADIQIVRGDRLMRQ